MIHRVVGKTKLHQAPSPDELTNQIVTMSTLQATARSLGCSQLSQDRIPPKEIPKGNNGYVDGTGEEVLYRRCGI